MTAPVDPTEQVRQLLPAVSLIAVTFLEVSMVRQDMPAPPPDQQFPVNIGLDYQTSDGSAFFRVRVVVVRPDITATVAVLVQYSIPEPDPLTDVAVAMAFAQRVAIPAAYPFARAKMHEVTIDSGTSPILLNVLDPRALGTPSMNEPAGDD